MTRRSRCTGYRPILDAFKVFAKVEPGAYTEEAIAASKASNGPPTGTVDAEQGVDGEKPKIDSHKKGGKVGCLDSGYASCVLAAQLRGIYGVDQYEKETLRVVYPTSFVSRLSYAG